MKRKLAAILITSLICLGICQHFQCNQFKEDKQLKYVIYKVSPGDCLSEIAAQYKPKYDTLQNFIAEIRYTNNIQGGICPGDELKIPVYAVK